ncbi:UDP-4-amino-4,6-dideoxy-N-acetyl-beta-L-altrosamine transaminase [Fodinicurvata fenggangensis]|uniref:UDP-4-amino-4, 6-dideoxy-N-acetyl-beta-L-altrosamine transaminase n=1 Tax=Fodinicurvata fenggangensis TaxID=1121830 RepID=UPI00047EA639|nr:UDP-4-amino-4,6-dideoxy-N-acetyl-beta-L-altrosamine transaminase [Fodinicurvata fenggangensis]
MSQADRPFLPYGRHSIDEEDVAAVAQVLRSGSLTGGPVVGQFEAALAETVGAPHAVACANGTAALHMAALAIGLGPGTAAVVPAVTFLATANAVRYTGAEVVFADVDPDSGLMEAEHLRAALARHAGPPVKAAFPVHLNGHCAELEALSAEAERQGLTLVEDACHALGGSWVAEDGEAVPLGSARYGALCTFSFHPVKAIAMGEGGTVTTRDPQLAERLRRLRNHGMTRDPADFTEHDQAFDATGAANPWYYEMPEIAYNYRASEINCALGLSQLSRLPRFLDRRRALAKAYDEALAALSPVIRPVARTPRCRSGWHLYAVRIDYGALDLSRAEVMQRLKAAGIGTQVHYLPVNRQPYYRARYGRVGLPGADAYYEACLSLPLFPEMEQADVECVVAELKTIAEA